MRRPLSLFIAVPATLAACDAVVRGVLWWTSRRAASAPLSSQHHSSAGQDRLLIVIPARAEGDRLETTLISATGQRTPANGRGAEVLLLLDGEDPAAEASARARGAHVVVKTPAGPSKAAALAWLAREQRALIRRFDIVLIIDAGSRFAPHFFEHFAWPGDAAAAQTYLSGTSQGIGAAAAASESIAQSGEDRGREALGWNVRLRGTGSAFRSSTFLELMPQLDTRVEDLEATLLLTADAQRVRMIAPKAIVLDDKPDAVGAAASQRARWLLGRYELLIRRAPAFARAIARRPAEGLAFFVEIFGRPLSLTAPLRLAAAALLLRRGQPLLATALTLTVASDLALHGNAHRKSPGAVLRLAGSWVLAVLLAPRALLRWMRP